MNAKVDELCNILLRTGGLKFGTFKLASGLLSPYYVDIRMIPSYPDAFQKTIVMYMSLLKPSLMKKTQRLVGVPTEGIAYATMIALRLAKPLLFVRKEHGAERRIEGLLKPGDRVVILDGVSSTGRNLLEAAEAIRSEGGIVDDAVVLLDRQHGAEENLKKARVKLHAFTTIHRIAQRLLTMGAIEQEQYREISAEIARAS